MKFGHAFAGLSYNIGNLFGSVRERERQETRALLTRVERAFGASGRGATDPYAFSRDLALRSLAAAEHDPSPLPLLIAVGTAIYEFVVAEELFELPDIDLSTDHSAEAMVNLRRSLRRKEAVLRRGEDGLADWAELVENTFSGILSYLPPNAEIDEVEDERALSVALIDLLETPNEVIERILVTWLTRDEDEAALFDERMPKQLLRNLRIASGIDPNDDESTKRLVLPTAAKNSLPHDLVATYLAGTPFETLFTATLPLTIPEAVRFEHCHILGGTGHGKTQLLQHLIHEDLEAACSSMRSVVVIDSQGDLIDTLLHLECFSPESPGSLADRLVVIDPTDIEHPPALNLFDANLSRVEGYSALDRERIIAGTTELYEYLFRSVFGAELTQKQGVVFSYLARLLLSIPNATIATFRDLLENGEPYREYMRALDGSAAHFFETEFFDRSFSATKQQLRRRLWGVFANPTLERMFSHPTSKLDLFAETNRGAIILIHTAKDILKQTGCEVAGRFFLALLGQAALERAALPIRERTPTFVYVDEAHDYFDEQIEGILNQARKYNVGLTLAHQNLDQLQPKLRATLAASTSIKLAGGVSAKDARGLAEDMHCSPTFIQEMRKRRTETEFAGYIKNITPQALRIAVPLGSVEALPRLSDTEYEELREANRERYCGRRDTTTAYRPPLDTPLYIEDVPPPGPRPPAPELPRTGARPQRPDAALPVPRPPDPGPPKEPSAARNRQHGYLQHLVRTVAQDRGFHVSIEDPILDGTGRVDISLSRDDLRIACEVSVTTSPEHELGNVLKCLAAGYAQVLVLSSRERHLSKLRNHISGHLEKEQRDRVYFLTPDDMIAHLEQHSIPPQAKERTIRGYRVKVSHQAVSEEDARARRDAVNKLIAHSVQRMKEKE